MRIILHSFLFPVGRSRVSCMISHKPNQLDERLGSKQRRRLGLRRLRKLPTGDRKICPVPGDSKQGATLIAQNHPGFGSSPEDPTNVSSLPTGGTLLSQNRDLCSLKCNIRCALFGG